jgi:diadenosine tetraphosphate (Ap4A) HIT family hydrolase
LSTRRSGWREQWSRRWTQTASPSIRTTAAYAGQDVAHFHQHVVPRQPGSNWGLGPPHLAHFATEERRAKEQAPVAITDEKRATVERLRRQLAPREVD